MESHKLGPEQNLDKSPCGPPLLKWDNLTPSLAKRGLGEIRCFKPAVCVPLFFEYDAVLKRPGLLPNLGAEDIDNILNYLLSKATLCQIYYLWRPCLKDPQDDMVLELAVQSQSQFIVTFNVRDFSKSALFGITAITPQQFLALNRSEK